MADDVKTVEADDGNCDVGMCGVEVLADDGKSVAAGGGT